MADIQRPSVQEKMRQLKENYLKHLRERSENILQLYGHHTQLNQQERDALKSHAHKLAGTGSTYGFPEISQAGRRLEEWLIANPDDMAGSGVLIRQLLTVCGAATIVDDPDDVAVADADTPAQEKYLPLLLIVDDDESILDMLKLLLSEDAQIITGRNSTEALSLIKHTKPDLVLLDDNMPGGISGLSLLERLQNLPELPIIMITASENPEAVMRGLMAGAVDYITKPFQPEQVAEKVRKRLMRLDNRILIADDDEAVRELLRHKFQNAGCKVLTAVDGAEAWSMLQSPGIGLALLDRMMPGFDGLTLLRKMRASDKLANIPVIFLTARHFGNEVLEGLDSGAADYIAKPFDPDEVVARCLRLLEKLNRTKD